MTRLEHRVEALRSVLPLLLIHHDLLAKVKATLDGWESTPSPLDEPAPAFFTGDPDCGWACSKCTDVKTCRTEEAWVRRWNDYRGRYRLEAVTRSLELLSDQAPRLATAVWCEYVSKFPEWNPKTRRRWADDGLEIMAREIPGPLYQFRPAHDAERRMLEAEVRRLRADGLTLREIARQLETSKDTARRVLLRS